MKFLLILLLLPIGAIAQKNPKADPSQVKADTLTADFSKIELDMLKAYSEQYQQSYLELEKIKREYEERLRMLSQSYDNLLKMKVSTLGGDPNKRYFIDKEKLKYLR